MREWSDGIQSCLFDPAAMSCLPRGLHGAIKLDYGRSGGRNLIITWRRVHFDGGFHDALCALFGVPLPRGSYQPYSGMLPCFFGGSDARFVAQTSSALHNMDRVRLGSITSST